ncbi:MAG: NAD-binding protein [Streptosporangiales bacterium]|nr:NAD-binding protein [Streptosporangiales bacterium]
MGRPMARNLLRAGLTVRAFDLSDEALADLADAGARPVASGAQAAEGAEAVFVSLPDSPHVEEAALGAGGIAEGAAPGTVVVDLSTIAAGVSRRLAVELARDLVYLDAPVSGGPQGAEAGTLSIMVGGSHHGYGRVEPLLRHLGRTVVHVGESGMGQVFKSCNQIVCAMNIQALCEAFALARSQGADLALLREVLRGGAAGSWMLDNLGPQMINGDPSAGFRIELQLKDIRLATQLALEAGVPLPGGLQVMALYLEAMAHGEGRNGNQALFRVYDRLSGQDSSRDASDS